MHRTPERFGCSDIVKVKPKKDTMGINVRTGRQQLDEQLEQK